MSKREKTIMDKCLKALKTASPYNAAMTREQFLFYEMRTTAKLMNEGLDKNEVVERIVSENLFQYPTEKSVRKMALACIRRLESMGWMTRSLPPSPHSPAM